MTIETWKEQAYSITAKQAAELSEKECAQHSLNKWECLRPEILKKHGMTKKIYTYEILKKHGIKEYIDTYSKYIRDINTNERFNIDGSTCSLCEKYHEELDCSKCPIFKMKGRSCDEEYQAFTFDDSPKPMIDLLKETLIWIEENE